MSVRVQLGVLLLASMTACAPAPLDAIDDGTSGGGQLSVEPALDPIEEPTSIQLRYAPAAEAEPSRVEFFIDGQLLVVDDEAPFTAPWLVNRGADNGERTISVVAYVGEGEEELETLEQVVEQALPEPGANLWTYLDVPVYDFGAELFDIEALPDNRVVVAAERDEQALDFMLDSEGELVWDHIEPGSARCAEDTGDELLVVGRFADLLYAIERVSFAGEQLETIDIPDVDDGWMEVKACEYGEGTLYSAAEQQNLLHIYADTSVLQTLDLGAGVAYAEYFDIALDSQGNILVGGEGPMSEGPTDRMFVAKLDPQGEVLWGDTRDYDSDPHTFKGIEVGPDDSVYVLHGVSPAKPEPSTMALERYDAGGELQWSFEAEDEVFWAVEVDLVGRIYLVSTARVLAERTSFRIWALDPNGEVAWTQEYPAPPGVIMYSMAMETGARGELWIGGQLSSPWQMWVGRFGI